MGKVTFECGRCGKTFHRNSVHTCLLKEGGVLSGTSDPPEDGSRPTLESGISAKPGEVTITVKLMVGTETLEQMLLRLATRFQVVRVHIETWAPERRWEALLGDTERGLAVGEGITPQEALRAAEGHWETRYGKG